MIVFYSIVSGQCIRSSNGVAEDVEIINNQAYINDEKHVSDMTNIAYEDLPDQDIYSYDLNGIPTPKLFSELKTGVPDEVRMRALEDMMLELMGI